MTDDRQLAAELVRAAGLLADRMLREGLTTEHKTSVSDVVSEADRAAEALVVQRLAELRPDDGLVGEEGAGRQSTTGRVWYIDPVDGTYNFLSGLAYWCSATALTGEIPAGADYPPPASLGAVYHPGADELWLGGPDQPTTCNDLELAPLADLPLSRLSVASYLHPATLGDETLREPLLAAMSGAATVRMLGSGSIELASVATGRLGAWVQHDSMPWDWLPGSALVQGAGGRAEIVRHRGRRWHVAGPPTAVAELCDRIVST